jgi:hypothetical protein
VGGAQNSKNKVVVPVAGDLIKVVVPQIGTHNPYRQRARTRTSTSTGTTVRDQGALLVMV